MPKRSYTPTETDRLTGERLRELRKRRGETLAETTERSGFGRDRSTLAATERGERQLTEIEAARLAAHFGVAVSQIITHPKRPALLPVARGGWTPATEQDWLGNTKAAGGVLPVFDPPEDSVAVQLSPPLFAVPDVVRQADAPVAGFGKTLVIDLNNPPSLDEYRMTVWIPYLENRYATEQKAS
jgi:transcriptional regulator with XRE-family HTH domain